MAIRSTYIILALLAITAIAFTAGCTAPVSHSGVLYGKDVFNPSRFSMATYSIGVNGSQSLAGSLIVLA